MANEISIRCKNSGKAIRVPLGSTLREVYDHSGLSMEYGPVAARINNKVQGLNYRFYNSKDVEFLSLFEDSGMRTYSRTLFLVLAKAVEDIYPSSQLIIGAPVSHGYYFELRLGRPVEDEDVQAISYRMREIVAADMPIRRIQCPIEDAIQMFRSRGMTSKVQLLETQGSLYTYYYKLENTIDYFYGCLMTRTSQLHLFQLIKMDEGLLLRIPSRKDPSQLEELVEQPKMLAAIREHHHWLDIMGVRTAGEFNAATKAGHATELINVAEALQERKLTEIADDIKAREAKIVLIAGPSSSGKTTTSKRLAIQLMCCGMHPHTISTDNYFVNRIDTPKDENGEYDFESLYGMDIDFLGQQLNALLAGEEVELPKFNFVKGVREFDGTTMRLGPNDMLFMEGIHALNPALTPSVDQTKIFRIYISALSALPGGEKVHNSTTDKRLLRRIVRDARTRGISPEDNILRWPSVRRGETRNIFPYEENADVVFNSSTLYDVPVLKYYAEPLLKQIGPASPAYEKAHSLVEFLQKAVALRTEEIQAIPATSIMREFIGGQMLY